MKNVYVITMWSGGRPAKKWQSDEEPEVLPNGMGVDFSEEIAKTVLSEKEITIEVTLGDGKSSATAYGCDLTYDYVKINGDYRT